MTPVSPDILQTLSAGIQSEVANYVFYIEAAKRAETSEFKAVLEKLAFEEKQHFHILERQHNSLIRSEQWISTADIMKMEGLPEIGEDMSEKHKPLIEEVRRADSLKTILEIAYRLEEEAYSLYSREASRSESPEGKKTFEKLAQFEKGHMGIIRDMMKRYVKEDES
jgi:rubrerythrin